MKESPQTRQPMRRRTRGIAVACAAFALAAAGAAARAQTEPPHFEATRYTIDAELFPSAHILSAKARIDVLPTADLSSLTFELNGALKVEKVADSTGQELKFHQEGTGLEVSFPVPLGQNKATYITVAYKGALLSTEGSPVENLKLAYVGPEGSYLLYAGRWFPVATGGLSRFAATLRITVPSDEIVVASGKAALPEHEPAKVTYAFQFNERSFPGTVLAGKYVVQPATAAGADMTFYMKEGHQNFVPSYGETAGKILGFYTDKFGALPSSHISFVEIEDGTVGGYTAPGVIALATRAFTNPVSYRVLAHEMSHLWWHCLVSPATRNDDFLDEGLATYSAAMDVQEMAGDAAFEDVMREIAVGSLTHEEVAPVSQASRLHEYTPEYESIVLQKGAMVFHMLRWVIGDDAFFKTLQSAARDYAWKGMTADEFEKLAEKTSGQDLKYFFAQWVSSTGVPQFKRTWAVYRTADGYQVIGKVQQDLDIFRMPVEIRVYTEAGKPVNARIDMVGTTADFTVNTKQLPTRVIVDPASRLLKYDERTKIEVEMARGDQLVQQQAYLEALKQYQAVLDLNKNSSLAHYRIGEIQYKLRNYNAASSEMRDALAGDLDPKWVEVWAHLMLGKIFDASGQRDRALNEYQRALQTNDNSQGALDEANRCIQKPCTEAQAPAGG